ncbi:sensor histidine kinase [Umezawaea sp.]|uniref:sensor histidine kinase n=1 Tax=Umezawaea sp. TaxID=1955258 RepID=UPI002ED4DCD4
MESTNLSWRTMVRRQWPLACALLILLALDAASTFDLGSRSWQLPGVVVLCVIAVLTPRRPFDAALTAAATLVIGSAVLRLSGLGVSPPIVGKLLITETAALMALIAILVREAPRWRAALGVVVLVATIAATTWIRPDYQIDWGEGPKTYGPELWPNVIGGTVFLIISVGTGLYFRSRDRERRQSVEAEVLAAQHAERMALARELHDVVAHYVTSIVVHSQAAEAVLELNPDAAREVLPVITNSGTEALAAMRKLVGTLRGSEPAGSGSVGSTSNLAADVRAVTEESGLPVHLEFDRAEQVPPEFERSVLRLVQESLTNSRKHATDVTRVEVSVSTRESAVHVRVADNGRGTRQAPVGGSGGYGLVGMRERVELLGGTFTAGTRSGDGWEVRAQIPITA